MEQIYDLIIIGSGPAGLGAAIYAKRAELKTLVIEKEMMSGGQVLTTYEVDNYAGLPGIGGFDLGMKFREHADKLGVEFAKDTVLKIETADLADENEVLEAAEAGAGHPPVIRQVVSKILFVHAGIRKLIFLCNLPAIRGYQFLAQLVAVFEMAPMILALSRLMLMRASGLLNFRFTSAIWNTGFS